MNALYLLRHAQAEPGRAYDDDHDRELAPEGRQEARRLGQFLRATDQLPDGILTSTAVRARETAEGVAGEWAVDVPLRSTHAFYQAQPADVLGEVQTTSDEIRALLLVGHEPAWSTTVSQMLGAANVSLPPGTCVRIDAEGRGWSDLRFGDGVLRWMVPPALLR